MLPEGKSNTLNVASSFTCQCYDSRSSEKKNAYLIMVRSLFLQMGIIDVVNCIDKRNVALA